MILKSVGENNENDHHQFWNKYSYNLDWSEELQKNFKKKNINVFTRGIYLRYW